MARSKNTNSKSAASKKSRAAAQKKKAAEPEAPPTPPAPDQVAEPPHPFGEWHLRGGLWIHQPTRDYAIREEDLYGYQDEQRTPLAIGPGEEFPHGQVFHMATLRRDQFLNQLVAEDRHRRLFFRPSKDA